MPDANTAVAEPLLRTLAPALRELEARLRGWLSAKRRFPLSTLQRATLEGLANDLGRQAEALQADTPLLVIMLMGGTGVGKSTLLNAFAGGAIAQASFARPTTRDPVVYYHQSLNPARLDPALRLCKLVAHDRPGLEQKIVVDTPDIDSNDLSNRDKLFRLLPVADVVLYVGSQEKYHDRLGWEVFLQHRQRRAFAFVLNKWDRCQDPGTGVRPDVDLLRDLQAEGFESPLLFRTCAQHWVDHPWQNNGAAPPAVEGEQFLELVRWVERGLNRLEIEAIKARGVGQLLRQLQTALEAVRPPDLTEQARRSRTVWSRLIGEEAEATAAVLLNTLEPYQKEIEHHFAQERQRHFGGLMGLYLQGINRLRYAGSTLRDQIPFTPKTRSPVETPREWDLSAFTQACSAAAAEQHLDARMRALGNRLLVEADQQGVPLNLMTQPTEAAARMDWKGRHAQAMVETIAQVERSWSQPTGPRLWVQRALVLAADWLPVLSVGVMGTILIWDYTMNQRPFNWGDLLLPFVVLALVLVVLHVLIVVVFPLRWPVIRAEFEAKLRRRLHAEVAEVFDPIPTAVAEEVLAERRAVDDFLRELREVSAWLEQRESAANVDSLYGSAEPATRPTE